MHLDACVLCVYFWISLIFLQLYVWYEDVNCLQLPRETRVDDIIPWISMASLKPAEENGLHNTMCWCLCMLLKHGGPVWWSCTFPLWLGWTESCNFCMNHASRQYEASYSNFQQHWNWDMPWRSWFGTWPWSTIRVLSLPDPTNPDHELDEENCFRKLVGKPTVGCFSVAKTCYGSFLKNHLILLSHMGVGCFFEGSSYDMKRCGVSLLFRGLGLG